MGEVRAFVEVLDRRGSVRDRIAVAELPASIGRAYSNAVIVDDPHVCPLHARIDLDADGLLIVEDLRSVNGTYVGDSRERIARARVTSGSEIRIGHTRIRLVDPEQAVPPAIVAGAEPRLLSLLRSPIAALGALPAAAGAFVLSEYLSSYQDVQGFELAGGAVMVILMLALWAGIWALVSRVVVHRFNFVSHYTLALVFFALGLLYGAAAGYLGFLFDNLVLAAVLVIATIALIGALLNGHLAFASPLPPRQRLAWAMGTAAVLFGVAALINVADEGFSTYTEDPGSLKPVPYRLIPAEAADEYIAALARVKAEVDELAAEEEPSPSHD